MAALVPAGLAWLMFVVGLDVTTAQLRDVCRRPRVLLAGLAAQMAGLPLLAAIIAATLALPPDLAIGLMIVAAAPGGVTSNFVTALIAGDVALSVVLTLLTSVLAVVSIPLLLTLAVPHPGGQVPLTLPVGTMMLALLVTAVVPLALGMAVRRRAPVATDRWRPRARRAATLVFLAIIALAVVGEWRLIRDQAWALGPAVLALNLAAMAVGALAARLAGGGRRQLLAVAVECGLQNIAMALLVATTILGRPDLGAAATVYAFVMNLTILGLWLGHGP